MFYTYPYVLSNYSRKGDQSVIYRTRQQSEWMTVNEVAQILGVSPDSVRRWAKQELLWAVQPHTKVLINRQSFEEFKVGREYPYVTSLRENQRALTRR